MEHDSGGRACAGAHPSWARASTARRRVRLARRNRHEPQRPPTPYQAARRQDPRFAQPCNLRHPATRGQRVSRRESPMSVTRWFSRPWNVPHDLRPEPFLERHDRGIDYGQIEAERRFVEYDARNGNANGCPSSTAQVRVDPRHPIAESVIEASCERNGANLEKRNTRRLPLAQLHSDAVDFAGVLASRVDELIVEYVSNQQNLCHDPPKISSGIDTIATMPARTLIMRMARLPNQPLVCSPR